MKSKKQLTKFKNSSSKSDNSIRLNKFLANAGLGSRREADNLIKMGLVEINGKITTEMGYQVKPNDKVKYDGSRVKNSALDYILINKPKGFIASSQKKKINKPVQDLISSLIDAKVLPIGDMGRPLTGLLILTNDEKIRIRINNSKKIHMVYHVKSEKNISNEIMSKLKKDQLVFDKIQKINSISHIPGKSKKEVGVEVHSISPLILTKLFEASGSKVIQMDRVVFGGLTKKDLPRGKWRRLTTKEIGFLKMMS